MLTVGLAHSLTLLRAILKGSLAFLFLSQLAFSHSNKKIRIAGLGTIFSLSLDVNKTSFISSKLENKLIRIISKYDQTFSHWSPKSELSRLQDIGLYKTHCPSPLFIKGLALSAKIYSYSKGSFDISHLTKNPSMHELRWKQNGSCFSFKKRAVKLDFGGIVKGMCVGELAQFLFLSGIKKFLINAGNGDLFFCGNNYLNLKNFSNTKVYFVSNSHRFQSQDGVWKPHVKTLTLTKPYNSSQVVCSSSFRKFYEWPELGAFADAVATYSMNNKKSFCFNGLCQVSKR
jgi:hypothetical protein